MSDSWQWATVTQVSPLRVRLDGEAAGLAVTPDTLTGPLLVGARVWVQLSGRRLVVHGTPDGGGAWATYTPTVTGFTLGNGTVLGRYTKIGRTVHMEAILTLGSTSAFTGEVLTIALPVATSANGQMPQGPVILADHGATYYVATCITSGGSNGLQVYSISTAQTFGVLSSGNPFVWVTGDQIQVSLTYEAAT